MVFWDFESGLLLDGGDFGYGVQLLLTGDLRLSLAMELLQPLQLLLPCLPENLQFLCLAADDILQLPFKKNI